MRQGIQVDPSHPGTPRATRMLGPGQHVQALDGVRGFAVLSVFLLHFGGGATSAELPIRIVGNAVKLGWLGVSIFFVLSGFLISGIIWDAMGRIHWRRNFYIRRAMRIFPLYYLAILITLLSSMWATRSLYIPKGIGFLLLYLQNFPPLFPAIRAMPRLVGVGHFWSLAVEEQFYFFWPFALMALARRRGTAKQVCIGLFVLSLIFRISVFRWMSSSSEWAFSCLLGRMGELCSGAYLALTMRGDADERNLAFRYAAPVAMVSSILLLATFYFAGGYTWNNFLVVTYGLAAAALLFTAVIALALRPGPVKWFFERTSLRWLGKISYGVYVYHLLFEQFFSAVTSRIFHVSSGNIFLIARFCVAAILTIAIATASFYCFELPLQRLKSRFPMKSAEIEREAKVT